jgi:hypothetical protein
MLEVGVEEVVEEVCPLQCQLHRQLHRQQRHDVQGTVVQPPQQAILVPQYMVGLATRVIAIIPNFKRGCKILIGDNENFMIGPRLIG